MVDEKVIIAKLHSVKESIVSQNKIYTSKNLGYLLELLIEFIENTNKNIIK